MQFGKKSAEASRRQPDRDEACRRQFDREEVMLAASALAVARSRSVVISDLSLDGAGLGGRDLPPPGDDLLMVVGSSDMMASVVWRAGDKCGIRFEQSLGDESVARMKQEANWARVTGWAR
jgi:hypothetical protein